MKKENLTMTSQEKIDMYINAHFQFYGIYPLILKRGAWLKINGGEKNYRSKDLMKLSFNLLTKCQERDIRTNHKTEKPWINYIDQETIDSFLEKLFIECHHSAHEMKTCIEDFAIDGELSKGLNKLWNDGGGDHEICNQDLCQSVNDLESEIKNEKEKTSKLKTKNAKLKVEISLYRKDLLNIKDNMTELRKKSVLFSMDDLETEYPKRHKIR